MGSVTLDKVKSLCHIERAIQQISDNMPAYVTSTLTSDQLRKILFYTFDYPTKEGATKNGSFLPSFQSLNPNPAPSTSALPTMKAKDKDEDEDGDDDDKRIIRMK